MRGEEQLREELQEFQKEKERIRNIVGQIGGSNNKQNKIVNTLLIVIIVALLVLGGVFNRITPSLAVQVAILFGVIKLIWMFYESQRASHFQFWILNSLEFRINEIYKKTKKLEKDLELLNKTKE
ncbi:hypothetical protein [uncultured Cetobacterium sp.]|uniref:hypothetical protein n=1 Tax=uncultured Cetobacterium sp. TaxID=527638 RepID=UPI00262C1336|nr:hypothetical protein [uncultured Cetobacterium sp.]